MPSATGTTREIAKLNTTRLTPATEIGTWQETQNHGQQRQEGETLHDVVRPIVRTRAP